MPLARTVSSPTLVMQRYNHVRVHRTSAKLQSLILCHKKTVSIQVVCVGADSLLALYCGLEKFYEALLPFNVLMSSSKDPADRNKATAIKAWVSKCVVVPEQAFDKLAQRTIYDTKQLENAYRAQLQSKHMMVQLTCTTAQSPHLADNIRHLLCLCFPIF